MSASTRLRPQPRNRNHFRQIKDIQALPAFLWSPHVLWGGFLIIVSACEAQRS